jgi:transcription elongation factor Elf1
MEAVMERLNFVCPTSGRDIDVGIGSELETLLRIRGERVRALCPVCGERHEWQVREAKLQQAA